MLIIITFPRHSNYIILESYCVDVWKNFQSSLNLVVLIVIHLSARLTHLRSNRPELFCKKGALRNFAKSTGNHLCDSLFFNKVAGLRRFAKIVNDF